MKLRFLAGAAAGYVLGARAGRERYDQILQAVSGLTDSRLFVQARAQISDLAGATTTSGMKDAGLVAPPVIVGPGPGGATGSSDTDVVLPDLESSSAVPADRQALTDERPARRLDPPATG